MFPGVGRWLYAHVSFTQSVKGKACVLVGGLGGREEKEREGEKERRRENKGTENDTPAGSGAGEEGLRRHKCFPWEQIWSTWKRKPDGEVVSPAQEEMSLQRCLI